MPSGARFLKITDMLPSTACIKANARALAQYARICLDEGLTPVVEPDVLMDGAHTIERCAKMTGEVLNEQFEQLARVAVNHQAMILKPNMITAGSACPAQPGPATVAEQTVQVLRAHVPPDVTGIVFLSGGQSERDATVHLNLIAKHALPWPVSFSYNRASQDSALKAWAGSHKNIDKAQAIFAHRLAMNSLASRGEWTEDRERQ